MNNSFNSMNQIPTQNKQHFIQNSRQWCQFFNNTKIQKPNTPNLNFPASFKQTKLNSKMPKKITKNRANGKSICIETTVERKLNKLKPTGRGKSQKKLAKLIRKQKPKKIRKITKLKRQINKKNHFKLNPNLTPVKINQQNKIFSGQSKSNAEIRLEMNTPDQKGKIDEKEDKPENLGNLGTSPVKFRIFPEDDQGKKENLANFYSTPPFKPKISSKICRPVQKTTYKKPQINWIQLKSKINPKIPKNNNTIRMFREKCWFPEQNRIRQFANKKLAKSNLFGSNSSQFGQTDKISNFGQMHDLVNPKIVNPNIVSYSLKQPFDANLDISHMFSRSQKKKPKQQFSTSIQLFPRNSPVKTPTKSGVNVLFTPKMESQKKLNPGKIFLSPETAQKSKAKVPVENNCLFGKFLMKNS